MEGKNTIVFDHVEKIYQKNKVIEDLNDYYPVEITNKVDSPDSRLTATFNDLPLDEVLMVINQTLDIRLVSRADKRK